MRLPIGSTGLSASGGTVTLIGRRGESWDRIGDADLSLDEAIALLYEQGLGDVRSVSATNAVHSATDDAPRFSPGEEILWRYARNVETARVIRDDARGLVAWIPSGSERLESTPADGRSTREVPLEERFTCVGDAGGDMDRAGTPARRTDRQAVVGVVLPAIRRDR